MDHYINISKYKLLAGRSCIKLPKQLDHPRKRLSNIENMHDNEWFKWCLARYLNPEYHHWARIYKIWQSFCKKLDLKDMNFSVKTRDIDKTEQNNAIIVGVFGWENKEKYPIYVLKNAVNINMLICYPTFQ